MKLIISSSIKEEPLEGVVTLSPDSLKYNSTHLFIASNLWDEISVEINDDTPRNILPYIKGMTKDFKMVFNEPSNHIVKLLSEVYPDKSGQFTRCFLKGGDLHELLS